MNKGQINRAADQVTRELIQRISDNERITIVKAPPGSGKTHLMVDVLAAAYEAGRRIAVATPTNAQSVEICERLVDRFPGVNLLRFMSSSSEEPADAAYPYTRYKNDVIAMEQGVVVATVAKWGFIDFRDEQPFDYLIVEEAWQVKMADFLPMLPLAARFVLVGDPGQIDPVVTIASERWATSLVGPQRAAPDAVLAANLPDTKMLLLPATRRLPRDSADLVKRFYDFDFAAYAQDNERLLQFTAKAARNGSANIWKATERSSVVGLTIDERKAGGPPPLEGDRAIAGLTAQSIFDLIAMKPILHLGDGKQKTLEPADIGIAATRRALVQDLRLALPAELQDLIRVETPERWQGLERPIMFAVHPLSSVVKPRTFDLETGRLCVMASRHKVQLFVVSRSHVPDALDEFDPPGDQALGTLDNAGRGHSSHSKFLADLKAKGVWIKAA